MEVDSMHSTIERKINVPADYVSLCKTACTTKIYVVEYLTYNFFKSFSKILFRKTILPGSKKGDPVVTDIMALYEPNKTISYKLRFTNKTGVIFYC